VLLSVALCGAFSPDGGEATHSAAAVYAYSIQVLQRALLCNAPSSAAPPSFAALSLLCYNG
jgi:hypothetical protein